MLARDMGRKAHDLLHYMTAPVPVPSMHTLQYVANRLPSGLDVISGIDTYSSLVEQAIKHPKAKYIEKELGLLSIQAIRAQIPYIEDGLPEYKENNSMSEHMKNLPEKWEAPKPWRAKCSNKECKVDEYELAENNAAMVDYSDKRECNFLYSRCPGCNGALRMYIDG